jgi:hypothetical protein
MSTLVHVAESASRAYVGPWNAFVLWCGSLMRPRTSLPADDLKVALYLQSILDKANTFSTIKSAPTSITFFQSSYYGPGSLYGENRGRKKVWLIS